MKNYYFIKAGMMLARSPQWEYDDYGFYPDGIGDCIGRSSKAALVYNNPEMLQKCVDLLKAGKRWPSILSPPRPHPKKLLGAKKRYRRQSSITRDPIIGVICSLWLMPMSNTAHEYKWKPKIKDITIRWWQNRPDLYHWKKYLETGKQRHKRKYEWWAKIILTKYTPIYVLNHMSWMAYVADSDKMKTKLLHYIPEWNYLLIALCDPIEWDMSDYKDTSGNPWSHPIKIEPPVNSHFYLDEDDQYKLGKDSLYWVLVRCYSTSVSRDVSNWLALTSLTHLH